MVKMAEPWGEPHVVSTTTTVDSLDELDSTILLAINPPFRDRERKELPHTIIYTDIDGKKMTEESFRKAFTTNISITVEHTLEGDIHIKVQANNSLIRAGRKSVRKLVEGCLSAIS
jgi:hypothetical protein